MAQSLVNVFGYSSTKCELVPETLTVEQMQNAIYANLDAGCPVLLGIQTTNLTQNAGHEIIADGYGIYNETIYTHLNLGWSGSCNAWYALPTVSVIGYQFSVIGSVIYNIFPNETGELVTGRVLDDEGRPVAGALLSASYRSGYSTKTSTGISDARGIFVLRVPSGASCSVTATASGFKDGSVSVKVGTSKSTNFSASEMTYSPGSGVIGNRWGNDIILKKAYWIEEPVFVIATRTELAAGRRIETQYRGFLTKEGFLYAWGKNGTAETDWAVGDGLPCELAKPAGDDWELMVMGEEK